MMKSNLFCIRYVAGVFVALLALCAPGLVDAQSSEVPSDQVSNAGHADSRLLLHLPMDGSLANRGVLGGETELVIKKGGSQPQFVDGALGDAFYFDGSTVLAIPVETTNDDYRTITMTGWVRMDDESKSQMTILSTGASVSFQVHQRTASATPGGPLFNAKQKLKPGEWSFIAAVYDMDNQRVRIQKDDEFHEHSLKNDYQIRGKGLFRNPNDPDKEPGRYLFIGGKNFTGGWPAKGIAIDDVRLYEGALTAKELAELAGARRAAQSSCTVDDIAGTYRTAMNVITCDASASNQLSCPYGPSNANVLTLQISASGVSATGTWTQPSGLGGPAAFDIDSSCSLTNGRWGMSGSAADRPWDTDGEIARVGGSDGDTADTHTGSGGNPMPSGVPGKGGLTDEQLEELRSVLGISEEEWDEARREAKRRAEANADDNGEAEESGTPPVDESPTGRPVPIGDKTSAGLSGHRGNAQETLDLETAFLRHVWWNERLNVPCEIGIGQRDSETNKGFRKCGGPLTPVNVVAGGAKILSVYPPRAVNSIRVCTTFNQNNRIKGLEIGADLINSDGTTTFVPRLESADMPNCSEWDDPVICGPGKMGTGLVVHYNRSEQDTYRSIVGLELICRKIGFPSN